MKIKGQQKIYLNLIIFGLLICLVLTVVISPLINQVKESSQTFQEKQRILFILKEKQDYLNQLQVDAQISQEYLEKIKGVFLQPEKAIDFITSLENIAWLTTNQLEIQILGSTQALTEPIEQPSLSFQLSLWGSFPNLIRSLIELENMDYLVQVENLRIRRLSERDVSSQKLSGFAAGDIETKMNILVYTAE